MDILDLERTVRPEWWLKQMKECDWIAGQFLYTLLKEERFHRLYGEKAQVLILADGPKLAAFCTYAEKDDIQPTELSPWMGFVYTFPEHRGHRYVGKLFEAIERIAKAEGISEVYISANHIGLYEKYGCTFRTLMDDMDGKPSRVYVKKID